MNKCRLSPKSDNRKPGADCLRHPGQGRPRLHPTQHHLNGAQDTVFGTGTPNCYKWTRPNDSSRAGVELLPFPLTRGVSKMVGTTVVVDGVGNFLPLDLRQSLIVAQRVVMVWINAIEVLLHEFRQEATLSFHQHQSRQRQAFSTYIFLTPDWLTHTIPSIFRQGSIAPSQR
jgi:hypothetical protein